MVRVTVPSMPTNMGIVVFPGDDDTPPKFGWVWQHPGTSAVAMSGAEFSSAEEAADRGRRFFTLREPNQKEEGEG